MYINLEDLFCIVSIVCMIIQTVESKRRGECNNKCAIRFSLLTHLMLLFTWEKVNSKCERILHFVAIDKKRYHKLAKLHKNIQQKSLSLMWEFSFY